MNIGKLGSIGALTSDTCNGEIKTCRLIVDQVYEALESLCKDNYDEIRVLEVDCWNPLRNMWLGGMTKALSTSLGNKMREKLDEIDLRLRFSTSIKSVLFAVNKEFSLCANYPKGNRELFCDLLETYHPVEMLLHIERESGSCQYLDFKVTGEVYMNHPYWIEFLDERLRTPRDNLLQENLFIILSSSEISALAHLCAIIKITICLST